MLPGHMFGKVWFGGRARLQAVLDFVLRAMAWAALASGLLLPTIAPALSKNLMIVLLVVGLVLWLGSSQRRQILRQPAVYLPLIAGVLLTMACLVTLKSPEHAIGPLAFVHIYLAGGLVALLQRLGTRLTLSGIALVALLGAAGGAAVTSFDVLVLGSDRGGLVNNPIRMAELTLPLGFAALIGLWGRSAIPRWVFLAGPILAIATVYFTGSRGPALAAITMLGVAVSGVCFMELPIRRALRYQAFALTAVLAVLAGVLLTSSYQSLPVLQDVAAVIQGDGSVDGSTTERLYMYEAALRAFQASPWVGHGFIDYVRIAESYALPGKDFIIYDHLHNDVANFAVVAGIVGVFAYFIFMASPIIGATKVAGPERGPMLYLGAVTTAGYIALGITDTTIGVHWQNVVFVTILAIIAVYAQKTRVSA